MSTMTSGVATVHGSQGLVELSLGEVCMHLGTIPFTKAVHRGARLLMRLLLADRAMLVKEPYEKVQQHACDFPIRAPYVPYAAPWFMPVRWRASSR
jgi:hypothetical protein